MLSSGTSSEWHTDLFLGNTTEFKSVHLATSSNNFGIWGTASTGSCSILFGLTTDGYNALRSKEILGDVHSLAWSPNGHALHALDSHSSAALSTSVTTFRIAEEPTLEDVTGIDVLLNVTNASQITAHPTGNNLYVVTKDSNELITIPIPDYPLANNATITSRHRLIPASLDTSQFYTSSLAVTASRTTLWTLSQSSNQAIISAFSVNETTGAIISIIARASWAGAGDGHLAAAPFERGNMIAVTNSPTGYVTLLELEYGLSATSFVDELHTGHDYLKQMSVGELEHRDVGVESASVRSYGRTVLDDYATIGECVWIN